MNGISLAKYEGLGNDFLILIDRDREAKFDAATAMALCDRHHGIGADGLIRLTEPVTSGELRMELLNADGSVAETSGNGMRCAVLCALDAGLIGFDEVEIETLVGHSLGRVIGRDGPGGARVRVDMGTVTVRRDAAADVAARMAFAVDVGNPHLALVATAPDGLEIIETGRRLEVAVPGGQNVELVAVGAARDSVDLETWERGAGFTLACGSGSCAAAAAARFAGLVDDRVEVRNPGGSVTVDLDGAAEQPARS